MQTHLKGFGLENFRVFKDYTWFDFAPITILTGPNSSGKSSLNKALMLIKDNFEKGHLPPKYLYIDYDENGNPTLTPGTIEFSGKVHGLNDPLTTKSKYSSNDVMEFTIPYDIIATYEGNILKYKSDELKDERPKKTKSSGLINMQTQLRHMVSVDDIFYDIKYKSVNYRLRFLVNKKKAQTLTEVEIRTLTGQRVLVISDHKVYFDVSEFNNLFESDDLKIPSWLDNHEKLISSKSKASIINWLTQSGLDKDVANNLEKKILSQLGLTKEGSRIRIKGVEDYMTGTEYLSTVRNELKRIYSDEDKSAFTTILENLDTARKEGFDFQEYLSDCFKMFDIDGILDFDYDSQKGVYFPNIEGQAFPNVGYGLSQIALFIFKIVEHAAKKYNKEPYVLNKTPSILIIEEPESNLHPKFQSLLADLIVEAADALNIQFIIETHSEYLIRKLQYLTAKKQVKSNDSVIYYFHDPNNVPKGETQIKKIEILEDGSLSDDFGPGFFDEAANWELELIRLKNAKNRNN